MSEDKTEQYGINEPVVEVTPEAIQKKLEWLKEKTSEQIAEELARLTAETEKWRSTAGKDYLTGLFNRRGLFEEFERIENTFLRESGKVKGYTIIFMDLVGLHKINKKEGMPAGDQKLTKIAEVLKNTSRRGTDLAARYGGDEFVIVGVNQGLEECLVHLKRIQEGLGEQNIKVNIGVANFNMGENLQQTLNLADEAMESAKKSGAMDETGRSLGIGVVILDRSGLK